MAFERRPRKKRAEKNMGYFADRLRIVKICNLELRSCFRTKQPAIGSNAKAESVVQRNGTRAARTEVLHQELSIRAPGAVIGLTQD